MGHRLGRRVAPGPSLQPPGPAQVLPQTPGPSADGCPRQTCGARLPSPPAAGCPLTEREGRAGSTLPAGSGPISLSGVKHPQARGVRAHQCRPSPSPAQPAARPLAGQMHWERRNVCLGSSRGRGSPNCTARFPIRHMHTAPTRAPTQLPHVLTHGSHRALSYTHTHTHTHVHMYTHAHSHTFTIHTHCAYHHTHMHTPIHMHMCTYTHTHTGTHISTHTLTCVLTQGVRA